MVATTVVVIQFLSGVVPLTEMAGFTPFLLQLLALRRSTCLVSGHPPSSNQSFCLLFHLLLWSSSSFAFSSLVVLALITMRRNRFEEILRFFHGANNANLLIEDKFAKVRPFLNRNFLASGHGCGPTNGSIDESMIPYYGRHPTKQFIRGKHIRWGYKG